MQVSNLSLRNFVRVGYRKYRKLMLYPFFAHYWIVMRIPKGRVILSDFLEYQLTRTKTICAKEGNLKFFIPNWLTYLRAETLLSRELETIAWIRSMKRGEILWDIGANIGSYSIFAAVSGMKVVAFEPSFLNLEILCRNIIENDLQEKIIVVPFALDSKVGIHTLFMSKENMLIGGAHNSIRQNLNYLGQVMQDSESMPWVSFTCDEIVDIFALDWPTHIKIDVDGCELEILKGANRVLSHASSILIEMIDENPSVHHIILLLKESLFVKSDLEFKNSLNQVWTKYA